MLTIEQVEDIDEYSEKLDHILSTNPKLSVDQAINFLGVFERGRIADELAELNELIREKG